MTWPFGDLRPLSYDLIVADPPWDYATWSEKGRTERSPHGQYDCMTAEEIMALPVSQLGRGDCMLKLWAVFPMLPLAIEVMKAWGFTYCAGGSWHKKTAHGKDQFGTGYRFRGACEPFLIGLLGDPVSTRLERNLIVTEAGPGIEVEAKVGRHSEKPQAGFDMLDRLCPRAIRRVELFARDPRPGWDRWGREAGLSDTVTTEDQP